MGGTEVQGGGDLGFKKPTGLMLPVYAERDRAREQGQRDGVRGTVDTGRKGRTAAFGLQGD